MRIKIYKYNRNIQESGHVICISWSRDLEIGLFCKVNVFWIFITVVFPFVLYKSASASLVIRQVPVP